MSSTGPIDGGLDVGEPFFAQAFGTVPAIAGRECDAEEIAQFAVEVRHLGLGPGQDPDAQVAQAAQVLREQAQGGALAHARVAGDQRETAFADLLFDAPAEALDLRGGAQGAGRRLGGEGIELEAVEIKEAFVHTEGCGGCG